jgi:hypothetical protein
MIIQEAYSARSRFILLLCVVVWNVRGKAERGERMRRRALSKMPILTETVKIVPNACLKGAVARACTLDEYVI